MNEIAKKAESVALAGSFMGIVVAAIAQEVLYAAIPLTVALSLNSFNRNQFEEKLENSLNQQNQPQLTNIENIAQKIDVLENIQLDNKQAFDEIARLEYIVTKLPEEFFREFNKELTRQPIGLNQEFARKSTLESSENKRESAVFWDYENAKVAAQGLKAPLAESLTEYSTSLGNPRVKKVYSDWKREKRSLVQALYSLGFETVHVAMGKENSVDVKLAVDCLAAAYQYPNVKQFIIVAADRDYVPLINRLKMLGKKVTLIGWSAAASESLLLSADEFIDMEQLSSDDENDEYVALDKENTSSQAIPYNDAVNYLIETIDYARRMQKSTRLETIASLMKTSPRFSYQNISSINKENGGHFSSFGAFVRSAEKQGKIKILNVEGFKEIFLPEDDPESESELSSQDPNKVTDDEWQIIIDQVRKAMEDEDPKHPKYGSFGSLIYYITKAKKDGRLSQSHRQLKFALMNLIKVGILIEQPDKNYRLTEKDIRLNSLISELKKNQEKS